MKHKELYQMKHKEFKEQFNAIKNSFNEAFFFKKAKMDIRYEKEDSKGFPERKFYLDFNIYDSNFPAHPENNSTFTIEVVLLGVLLGDDFLIGANYVNRRMNINLHTGLSKGRNALNLRRKLCEILKNKKSYDNELIGMEAFNLFSETMLKLSIELNKSKGNN